MDDAAKCKVVTMKTTKTQNKDNNAELEFPILHRHPAPSIKAVKAVHPQLQLARHGAVTVALGGAE